MVDKSDWICLNLSTIPPLFLSLCCDKIKGSTTEVSFAEHMLTNHERYLLGMFS